MELYTFEPVDNKWIIETTFTEPLVHHARCDCQTWFLPPRYVQTHLISKNGYVGLSSPETRQRCTPAPHAIRRIANTSIFSTNNPALTSILRFPAEIRLQIYSLLLIADEIISYHVCPAKLCLVLRGNPSQRLYVRNDVLRTRPLRRPFVRQGIFPSILRCCKIIYSEGMPILYGQNTFAIEHATCTPHYPLLEYTVSRPIVSSFPLRATSLESITKIHLRLFRPWGAERLNLRNQLKRLTLFPGLKEASILCYNAEPAEVMDLVEEVVRHDFLRLKLCFELHLSCAYVEWTNGMGEHLKKFYGDAIETLVKYAQGMRRVVNFAEQHEDVEDPSQLYWGLFKGTIRMVVA